MSEVGTMEAASRKLRGVWVVILVGLAALAPRCEAAGRSLSSVDLAGAWNPLGLKLQGELGRRWGDADTSYLQAGGGAGVSPAYAQGSAHGEWMPARFLVLRAQYDLYGFFGSSGSLLSFESGDADFGPDELEDRKGDEEAGLGQRLLFQPTLRARLGPVILRNQTDLAWYRFHGDGPYFYEQEYDTLLTDGDLLVANRTQALADLKPWARGGMLYAGPFYELVRARDAAITRQRWGAVALWESGTPWPGGWKPHAMVQLGVNTQDRNRDDEFFAVFAVGASVGP